MTTTFESLGVSSDLVAALAEQGIAEPFAIQTLTIADALAGRDVLGKAKTGSGKTLAFGIPLLDRITKSKPNQPHGLVLLPTRELANQVTKVLIPLGKRMGLTVQSFYGGTSMEPQFKALADGVDLAVGTPGRLIDLVERGELDLSNVQMLVLDEADRMADMGFMPQVQKLLYRIKVEHQTLLFSATLDSAVDLIERRYMRDPVHHEVESDEPTVTEMEHRFLKVHKLDAVKVAAAIINNSTRTLLFVNTKRAADNLVDKLAREGIKAGAIHGDLRQQARERSLEDFTKGKVPALVATDVAARGLHIDGVDVVIHFDPADDPKNYLHRSGRTARAGELGVAVTFMLYDQENTVRMLLRRLQIDQPMVEVFSNDPRLADLRAWDPSREDETETAAAGG
jgi:superfamily II DNA/RNA helicase